MNYITTIHPVTTIIWTLNVEVLDKEDNAPTTWIQTHSRRLIRLARMIRPLDPDPLQPLCAYSTRNCNELHISFHPMHQYRQSTVQHSVVSVGSNAILSCNARPFRRNTAPSLSTLPKPSTPILRDAHTSAQRIRTADVP